jgi:uncharacterized protein involved in exopolysaccharide biosynthesis
MFLVQILRLLKNNVRLFTAVFLSVFGVWAVATKLIPKTFEGTSLLIVDYSRNQRGVVSDQTSGYSERSLLDEFLRSQISIIESENVVEDAVRSFGPEKLGLKSDLGSDQYLGVLSRVSATVMPESTLIKIAFRAASPEVAAGFANAIASSYLNRYSKIYSNPQAASFFEEQANHFREQSKQASGELQHFMVKNNVYEIDQQRKLLLERRDKATADLLATEGEITRQDHEINSIKVQLSSLRAKINLPVEIFGDPKVTRNIFPKDSSDGVKNLAVTSGDPSLLHVKLYQDAVEQLVKANSALYGLQALAGHQRESLTKLDEEIQRLSQSESEFKRLRAGVDDSDTYASLFIKRGAEAQVESAWRSNALVSNIQVVQAATPPMGPVAPRTSLLLGIGALVGMIAALGAVLARDPSLLVQVISKYFPVPEAALGTGQNLHPIVGSVNDAASVKNMPDRTETRRALDQPLIQGEVHDFPAPRDFPAPQATQESGRSLHPIVVGENGPATVTNMHDRDESKRASDQPTFQGDIRELVDGLKNIRPLRRRIR